MKRILAILIAVMMCVSLVACGGNGGGSTPTEGPKNPEIALIDLVKSIIEKVGAELGMPFTSMSNEELQNVLSQDEIPDTFVFPDFAWTEYEGSDPMWVNEMGGMSTKIKGKGICAQGPMMPNNDIIIVRAPSVADVASIKTELVDILKKNEWFCNFPEEMYVVDSGDYILVVYSQSKDLCDAAVKAFDEIMDLPLGEKLSAI